MTDTAAKLDASTMVIVALLVPCRLSLCSHSTSSSIVLAGRFHSFVPIFRREFEFGEYYVAEDSSRLSLCRKGRKSGGQGQHCRSIGGKRRME
ncbi:unnamed protein product [Haemonchus placei]|uniref:Secreted protein n=1 Tax=Haemonchus placei TaxID=6290 RepID=A0A0N4W3R6_HAEPC|nr:unnamed protein product [Haemonchus placei]